MAESPNDRRERIAEALFVMLMGHCAAGNMLWSADLCAHKAREWADTFVADEPEQPQPPADDSPSLLEAAKEVVHAAYCAGVNSQFSKAYNRMIDAIEREEARRG